MDDIFRGVILAVNTVAERLEQNRKCLGKTTQNRRVLSWFFFGIVIITQPDPFLTTRTVREEMTIIRRKVEG